MAIEQKSRGIRIASLIWLVCIAAALIGAGLRNSDVFHLVPIAGLAAIPAVLSLILSPVLEREWAKIIVLFCWLALAIIGCLAFSFMPMAFLFLSVPAIAAVFDREKVIEAMVLSGVVAAGLFYFSRRGEFADLVLASGAQMSWGTTTGIAATIGLIIAALYAVSGADNSVSETEPSENILDAVPGGLLRIGEDNKVNMVTEVAATR